VRRALLATAAVSLFCASSALAASSPTIRTLSNRADILSGGDALVQVLPPTGGDASKLAVAVDGRDVTSAFGVRADGRYLGLLKGLSNGSHTITAFAPGGRSARLALRNHPIGGPVIAGPQIKPWTCFAGATDAQCNRPVSYDYYYRPEGGGSLQSYDPSNPPGDVSNTTTDQGKTVPFVVRQETGAIDRDEYRIAVLFDPKKPWAPTQPQDGFNHKIVIFHGASCDTGYSQADAPDVLNETALGRGFATMSHALDNAGHNCNIATQAESLIMTKEHLVDTYGSVRYTIGSGCSGGSLVQQQVANAYPGLYQGITPACSFTDAWSSAMQYVDYQLLLRYFNNPGSWGTGVAWTPNQMAAVEGHINPVNAVTFTTAIPSSGDPSRSCPGVPADKVFDEQTNPHGVRCTLQDYMINIFGKRPQDGYAERPYDNIGIQYGLAALKDGTITPAQFADLNSKLGAYDMNYNDTKTRTTATPVSLDRVYKSGAVDQADNLDEVAIIDLRGPDPGAFHDVYRTYAMRARLKREHGTTANQVLWRGQVPLLGDSNYADQSIVAVDSWLAVIEKDTRAIPLARKVIEDKPKAVTDRCTNGNGTELPASACDGTVQAYATPRIVAGMPQADDTIKCGLQPLRRTSYTPAVFTDADWSSMVKTYPSGVCDYAKPGAGRRATVPWQSYQAVSGKVVYGGRGLGAVPRSSAAAPPRRCVASKRLRFRFHRTRSGARVVRVVVYVNGKRRLVRRGRNIKSVSLARPVKSRFTIRIVTTFSNGAKRASTRTYRGCKKSRPRTSRH
jgi:uncharacterized tannase-like protein DUF6351